MKNKLLVLGIVILSAFILFSVWKVVLRERLPLLSYRAEVETMLRLAQNTVEKYRPPHTEAEGLKRDAQRLRERHHRLIEGASDDDKRRPSYRKMDDLVTEIEHAARSPQSADVVAARFGNATELIEEVRSLLGSSRDQPE